MTNVKLRELVEVTRGNSYTGAGFTGEGPRLVGMGEIDSDGFLKFDSTRPYSGPVKESHFLRENDIAMSTTDLTQDGSLLGRSAIFTEIEHEPIIVSHHLLRLRASSGIDPFYLRFLLMSRKWLAYINSMATGTTVRAVSINDVSEFSFDLPPITEQLKLSTPLKNIDKKLKCNETLTYLLEKEAHMEFARRFDVSPINSGSNIYDYVELNPNRKLVRGTLASYLGMSSMPKNSASAQSWTQREYGSGQRFQNGDTLMARISPCLENGKISLVDFLEPGEVGWGSTEYLVFAPREGISPMWVYCMVRSDKFINHAIQNMTGTSGRQRCPANAFDRYKVKKIEIDSIAEFTSQFEANFSKIKEIRDENRLLRTYRASLVRDFYD
jgi:type I restriction enzyme, S subunit